MQAIWFVINISDDFLEDYEKDVNIEVEKGTKRKKLKYFWVSFNKKVTDLYKISYILRIPRNDTISREFFDREITWWEIKHSWKCIIFLWKKVENFACYSDSKNEIKNGIRYAEYDDPADTITII